MGEGHGDEHPRCTLVGHLLRDLIVQLALLHRWGHRVRQSPLLRLLELPSDLMILPAASLEALLL